jgi:tetratricopeptide (TPR) repeat protein
MNIVTDTSLALFHDSIAQAWDALYKNDMAGAMSHARQAAIIGPDLPETFHILGLLASRDGRSDIALPLLEKALAAGAIERRYRDLAEACMIAGDAQSALAYLQQALLEFERSAEVCGLLAAVYVALDDYANAAEYAKEAIALKPHLMAWEGSLAFCHLIQGDYTNGFEIYTGRSQNLGSGSRCPVLHFTKPGELWLKNEQGPGDTLFFARFAKPLAEAGWKIHLQTDKKTKVLLRDTGLFASVKEAITPPLNAFWLNMGDLPLAAIQIGATEIQPPLDLLPDQARINKVRDKLAQIGPAPYIAVTWRAGARGAKQRAGLRMYDKIASPEDLGKLLSGINATIISIQRVPDSEEQAAFAAALGRDFINFSHYNDNLQDMLALLSVVDDYVAVPNTNVHLRESLNLSSQVLVNRPYQDWRWLADGSTSPWYPNSKVYRQDVNQDWTAALTALAGVLHERFELMNSDSATLAISKPRMMQNEVEQMLQNGWAAVNSGDIAGAIQAAQSVMQLTAVAKPGNENPEALHLLGWAALRDAKHELAINILQRAAEISQIDGRIIGDYVRALSAGKRHHEAIECASDALCNSAVKNVSSIYFSRAAAFLQLNHLEDAIADYEACIKINPNRLDAQEYCGMARLKFGDTVQGFRDYTARNVAKRDELLNDWCCPRFTKEDHSSHVLIKRDMGLGDELTFLRYLPWLTQAGIKVDYWAGKKLVPILERTGYFNQVFSDADPAPGRTQYDLSFIVNDLPVAVEALGTPPVAPPLQLKPKSELVEKWRKWLQSIGNGPYIGINWRAGVANEDVARSRGKLTKAVDADAFAQALSPINATWVSLQRNIVVDELQQFKKTLNAPVHDAAALTDDLEDLLALLSLLDENIGVSNTNMHLRAGLGLGSKVLVQTPGGDWRWGYQGHQSSWFMESKVYRQHLSEDWSTALNALQSDLIARYGNKIEGKQTAASQSNSKASSKRLIWLTAGVIKNDGASKTSALASARYRVLAPAAELEKSGWHSEFVNEAYAQAMGGWGSNVPQKGDTVIISKVFTDFSVRLAQDAKNRGATVIVDFCDNFLAHPKRGLLQRELLALADTMVASTEVMSEAIQSLGYSVAAVISDPVGMPRGDIRFQPQQTLKLLWFGHAVNLDTLAKFLPQLTEFAQKQPFQLNVVTSLQSGAEDLNKIIPPELDVIYIPWSLEATQQAIQDCDAVIIPTLATDMKKAKSPNRLLEPLWAGRMVIAGYLPAYLPFGDSAWVGENLIEGLQWAIANPQEVTQRILQGQADIAQQFTQEAIGRAWRSVMLGIRTLQKHKNVNF